MLQFYCPACGETTELSGNIILSPGCEIECPNCKTLWQIEGFLEVEKEETDA